MIASSLGHIANLTIACAAVITVFWRPSAMAATAGEQLFKLRASDAAAEDFFGVAVAVSGNLGIVGSEQDDGNLGLTSNAGSAYLFDLTTGRQLRKFVASDPGRQDLFGHSVGISNGTAIVGARFDDDGGTATGSAYLFDVNTGTNCSN